jgi:hypothetical protein
MLGKCFLAIATVSGVLVLGSTTEAVDAPGSQPTASTSDSSLAVDATTNGHGDKHLLRYHFREGEVVRSKVIQQTKIETTIAGTTQTAEMTSISTKAWRVTEVEDPDRITFETMIEEIDMRQQMSGRQEVRYNSKTDPKPPPGYETAAASVGKLLTTITIDSSGKLIRREKKYQQDVENMNALVVVPLPEKAVAIGEPWSVPLDVTVALDGAESRTLTVKNRYQLEKVDKGIATISVQTVLPPVNDPRIRAQLVQRMAKGTLQFDITAGRLISQHTDLDEQVIGFSGPNSNLQYVGRFSEELLADDTQAAKTRRVNR